MAPKVSVFVATSLDGFIARKDGSLDWLDQANANVPSGEDGGFKAFMATVGVLVMGRNTFDKVMSFGIWPYGDTKVIVLTNKPLSIPVALSKTVSISSKTPKDLWLRLGKEGVDHIYVDGGLTIQSFLKENLVDELTVTLAPVVLGEGKFLFGPQNEDIVLRHLATKNLAGGFVQVKYAVIK